MAVDLLLETDAPKRRSAPLVAACHSARVVVVQTDSHDFGTHIVEEVVRIGVDGLRAEPRELSAVEERRASRAGVERRDVAEVAFGLVEHRLAISHSLALGHCLGGSVAMCEGYLGRGAALATRGDSKAVEVEIDALHVGSRDIELVVCEAHHGAFGHL